MTKRKTFRLLYTTSFIILVLASCNHGRQVSTPPAPDYSVDRFWSIKDNPTHDIDVFFVHPTTYGPPADGKYIADLSDQELNKVTDQNTVQWITDTFRDSCNIFAPRYRQVNIEVMKMDQGKKIKYMTAGANDVEAAFKYYLTHLNNGRPYILASHSQGSNVLQMILLKNPGLVDKSKLVAAYMPGWTFTDKDLEAMGISLGESPQQTGCLLTWNTIGPGGISPTVSMGARCVNPLSWTADRESRPASMNIGARIFISPEKELKVPHFTAAKINSDGTLEIPSPREDVAKFLNMSLGKEIYHRYDYDFFYENIRKNVKVRCEAFKTKQ